MLSLPFSKSNVWKKRLETRGKRLSILLTNSLMSSLTTDRQMHTRTASLWRESKERGEEASLQSIVTSVGGHVGRDHNIVGLWVGRTLDPTSIAYHLSTVCVQRCRNTLFPTQTKKFLAFGVASRSQQFQVTESESDDLQVNNQAANTKGQEDESEKTEQISTDIQSDCAKIVKRPLCCKQSDDRQASLLSRSNAPDAFIWL